MTISSKTLVELDGWKVRKVYDNDQFSHFVLEVPMDKGHASNQFLNVRASDGLLMLQRNNTTTVSFSGIIDGENTYDDNADMPKLIFETLKNIGPY